MTTQFLLLFQLLAHSALLCAVYWFTPFDWLLACTVYVITGSVGMTACYHRLLAHRSWMAPRWLRNFTTMVAVYGLIGPPLTWVAQHRQQHHDIDPTHRHSWWRIQWLMMLLPVDLRYANGLLRDRFLLRVHHSYCIIHCLILTTLLLTLGLKGAMIWYLVPAAILWNSSTLVNSLCHQFDHPPRPYNSRPGYSNQGWATNLIRRLSR